jgi:hypothetical protein
MTSSKTGLFSATVAAFVIEFYKKLSPDSGDQTVALLGQISQQLANSQNGTFSIMANQPSPPSASMIWANAMWLISLLLSLASALIATMLQQWARRYVETPHIPSDPNHRARARFFLSLGTETYKIRLAVQVLPTLVHLSVFLFFGGLMILYHTIHKKVAIGVDVVVGLFGLVYIALTILPCLDVACPYRTPMSHMLWYPWHTFLYLAAICLRQILVCWSESLKSAVKTHRQYFTDGLGESIMKGAINAQEVERKIVTRLFDLLVKGDISQLPNFVASIPRHRVDLIPFIESGSILLDRLIICLRSCAASARSELGFDVRQRSLLLCLNAVHYIVKGPSVPNPGSLCTDIAHISLMQPLWDDGDPATRVASRSICALLAKQVVRAPRPEAQLLRWLEDVTGETPTVIFDDGTVGLGRTNIKSFVYGVLQVSKRRVGNLPTEVATSFKETLAILLDVVNDAHFDTNFERRLSEEVEWLQQHDPQGSREAVDRLRPMFPFLPENPLPDPHAPP